MTPVFCEINEKTLNIDVEKIEALITNKTKAIVPIHYAGIPSEMDKINKIASKYKLVVIEDAALPIASIYQFVPSHIIFIVSLIVEVAVNCTLVTALVILVIDPFICIVPNNLVAVVLPSVVDDIVTVFVVGTTTTKNL